MRPARLPAGCPSAGAARSGRGGAGGGPDVRRPAGRPARARRSGARLVHAERRLHRRSAGGHPERPQDHVHLRHRTAPRRAGLGGSHHGDVDRHEQRRVRQPDAALRADPLDRRPRRRHPRGRRRARRAALAHRAAAPAALPHVGARDQPRVLRDRPRHGPAEQRLHPLAVQQRHLGVRPSSPSSGREPSARRATAARCDACGSATISISGRVQGVGFRYFAKDAADREGRDAAGCGTCPTGASRRWSKARTRR